MAITAQDIKINEDEQAVQLTINNGDLEKVQQVISEWGFLDYQSFIRFAVSIMLVTKNHSITIQTDTGATAVVPSPNLLKNAGK